MKVLITGSHGFVGTNLTETLSGKHEIIRWDVRSDEKLPDCDAVIHLAGKAHDVTFRQAHGPHDNRKGEEYFEVNAELTKRMFDIFLQSKAKKFIFFSSIKAQDNDTPYAKSKKAAEDYIIDKVHDSKRVYILRPCMIHGKGVKGNLPLLFKFVKEGWPWPLAAFENKRSYASMGNVSYVVSELLKNDAESGVYNICDDEAVSSNELIRLMCEGLGKKPQMWRIPKGLVRIGSKIGDVLHLPLNSERLEKLAGDCIVDNSDIKRVLRVNQLPIRAREGLKYTIREMVKKEEND